MKNFTFTNFNTSNRIFGSVLLLSVLLIGGWTLYAVAGFTLAQFVVLVVAMLAGWLINQHELTIPTIKSKLSADCLTVFSGVLMLGAAGGVLLAATVCAVRWRKDERDKTFWLFNSLRYLIAAFAAGALFSHFFGDYIITSENYAAESAVGLLWLVIAAALSGAAYYISAAAIKFVTLKLENNTDPFDRAPDNHLRNLQNTAVGVTTALILQLALMEFGLPFGIVILLATVAAHYAYHIHTSRLAQKTREITEASRVHLATVEALATAIDARDQVGIGHVRRTQVYAVGIGSILGLPADELEALNTGALLHDIGKLAVPDHILNKPGRLTPAEMEKIKIHASVGASILEKVNFAYPVVPTVKYHHEMWDGSGYPEGLRGENIPLTARILSVADAFDSLRGVRSYRAAVSRDEARRFLINGSGTQFDQKIVDIFLRNLQKLEAQIEAQGLSYSFDEESAAAMGAAAIDENSDRSYVEQIKRANREVYTLYELARVFSSSLNLEETLSLFVQKIGDLVPFDTCIVYLFEDSQEFAKAVYIEGDNKNLFKGKRVKTGEGATGFVLKKRQARCAENSGLDFSFNQPKLTHDYSAMASLPLMSDDRMLGAVSLYSHSLKTYEEEHLRLLETVARIASDALGLSLQHAESENRALTDSLTSLPNARSLQLQFERETARADRSNGSFQVLMLDLDGFKAVNDTYGHTAGDRLLKELAKVMSGQLRDYDFLARYAGDEFVVIVPETDAQHIEELCRRIGAAVFNFELPVDDGKTARVGISIGSASYPQDGATLDEVIVAADKQMYAAKAERKKKNAPVKPLPVRPEKISEADFTDSDFIVELDESHVISSAIN